MPALDYLRSMDPAGGKASLARLMIGLLSAYTALKGRETQKEDAPPSDPHGAEDGWDSPAQEAAEWSYSSAFSDASLSCSSSSSSSGGEEEVLVVASENWIDLDAVVLRAPQPTPFHSKELPTSLSLPQNRTPSATSSTAGSNPRRTRKAVVNAGALSRKDKSLTRTAFHQSAVRAAPDEPLPIACPRPVRAAGLPWKGWIIDTVAPGAESPETSPCIHPLDILAFSTGSPTFYAAAEHSAAAQAARAAHWAHETQAAYELYFVLLRQLARGALDTLDSGPAGTVRRFLDEGRAVLAKRRAGGRVRDPPGQVLGLLLTGVFRMLENEEVQHAYCEEIVRQVMGAYVEIKTRLEAEDVTPNIKTELEEELEFLEDGVRQVVGAGMLDACFFAPFRC